MVLFKAPEPATAPPRKRTTRKVSAKPVEAPEAAPDQTGDQTAEGTVDEAAAEVADDSGEATSGRNRGQGGRGRGGQGNRGGRSGQAQRGKGSESSDDVDDDETPDTDQDDSDDDSGDGEGGARRRRRRGGRRRRKPSDGEGGDNAENQSEDSEDSDDSEESEGDNDSTGSRRRRRRRRTGDDGDGSGDAESTPRARKQRTPERNPEDEITSIGGSTRLEAKKQRRREGREAGRRRAPIVSEAEFLARRESVDRVMVIRQKDDLTQIGVLEDKVLVEHYVARESQTSLIGNVYLGRVQNVLPSMEAAFIDIGKGRNAVLYAGEVNWSAVGHKEGQPRKIESVLSSGQTILVQVSKDPVGHKGARLTGQVSLPGRFLVYVPDGNTSGISRKLPDTERNRLKTLLKQIVPDSAGVIVRTAAEGASEEELTLDVERLTARWAEIEEKVKAGKSPQMLYGEPDLTLKVVRDLFTEDFAKLVVQGDDAWNLVEDYVSHVAPDLQDRLERYEPGENGKDLFTTYRVDEQIAKGLDRKVWLPSGGSLIIDRTEAMTVVDVNTGKFTGSGGNLEETVTKNNLEAAEEMVRQLRLRDIGGIIVIDFIDMVLESNRDLVLRRLVECLGRDRTRHQVAEVTSLGLVQMTRKRIGTGLLEAFSTDCEHCKGRGLIVHEHPVESGSRPDDDDSRGRGRGRGGRNRGRGSDSGSGPASGSGNGGGNGGNNGGNGGGAPAKPSPADLAKSRPPEKTADDDATEATETTDAAEPETPQAPETESPKTETPKTEAPPAAEQAEQGAERSVVGTPTQSDHEPQHVPTESAAESPAEPAEAPRVVTSTRRRTARRPAGPPSPLSEPVQIPVEPAPHGDPVWPSDGADGSSRSDLDADGGPTDHGDDHGDENGEDNGEDNGDDASNANSLLHVPVKRKGSRKR
jgi:ribonuclease E